MAPKVVPGIDPALVAVVPAKADRISPHWGNRLRAGRFLVHLQESRRLWLRHSGLPPGSPTLFMASSTGASLAQPGESPVALVAVLPVDLHAGPGCLLYPDSRRFRR